MDYIIDGYNLIFQCGLQTRAATDDLLRQARRRLIGGILSRVPPTVATKMTIVFDAAQRPLLAEGNSEIVGGMKIFYADQYDDADSMIEYLIGQHSAPRKLTIVSSDHRLHKAALRRRAIPIDSDVWFDQLESHVLRSGQTRPGQGTAANAWPLKRSDDLLSIDWQVELGTEDVKIAEIQAQIDAEGIPSKGHQTEGGLATRDAANEDRVEQVGEIELESESAPAFNPFPPGYGEDLLDE